MGFEKIVESIKSLPPLPESIMKLEKLLLQGEPDMKAIVSVIESDPVLTADVLAKVNSPMYSYSKQIVSVMQAVTLFGLATIRAMVLKSSMDRNFDIDMSPYGISNSTFAQISAMQSALMFQWYMGVDVEKAKVLVPIAFLMEMGKVIIAKELIESAYGDLFKTELALSSSVSTVEREFTGTTSTEVCALLFKHWFFGEIYIEVMVDLENERVAGGHRDLVNALRVVQKAVNVKAQLTDESIEEAAVLVKELGLDTTRFMNAARRIKEKLK